MIDELLTTAEVARFYRISEASIRTALWRFRLDGTDPGIPLPLGTKIRGRYRWSKKAIEEHMTSVLNKGELK